MLPACLALPRSEIRDLPGILLLVRVTHWITVISFVALLVSGVEIFISHPRFYWGEVGNSLDASAVQDPHPFLASRQSRLATDTCCPTRMAGAGTLHFEAAWALALTGLVYFISGCGRATSVRACFRPLQTGRGAHFAA